MTGKCVDKSWVGGFDSGCQVMESVSACYQDSRWPIDSLLPRPNLPGSGQSEPRRNIVSHLLHLARRSGKWEDNIAIKGMG